MLVYKTTKIYWFHYLLLIYDSCWHNWFNIKLFVDVELRNEFYSVAGKVDFTLFVINWLSYRLRHEIDFPTIIAVKRPIECLTRYMSILIYLVQLPISLITFVFITLISRVICTLLLNCKLNCYLLGGFRYL